MILTCSVEILWLNRFARFVVLMLIWRCYQLRRPVDLVRFCSMDFFEMWISLVRNCCASSAFTIAALETINSRLACAASHASLPRKCSSYRLQNCVVAVCNQLSGIGLLGSREKTLYMFVIMYFWEGEINASRNNFEVSLMRDAVEPL